MRLMPAVFLALAISLSPAIFHSPLFAQSTTQPFQLSQFISNGGSGWNQSAAYNKKSNEYLAVWSYEISNEGPYVYAQRLDAASGATRGNRVTVTPSGFMFAHEPAVAYNPTRNEYLVVFAGDNSGGYPRRFGREIYAQRLNADNLEKVGALIRVSDLGFEDDPAEPGASGQADDPAVVYNEKESQYMIVWWGQEWYHNPPPAGDYYAEWEVFGQAIAADSGAQVGANDFRISTHGNSGENGYVAKFPSLAYNSVDNEYLISWTLDQFATGNSPGGVYGRRIDGHTRALLASQFRIDTTGQLYSPAGTPPFSVYNSLTKQYLVTWTQYDAGPEYTMKRGYESFSQRLDAKTGAPLGGRVRLSQTGPTPNAEEGSMFAVAGYDAFRNQYLVVWDADPNFSWHYITGQMVDANSGQPIRNVDFRFSDVPSLTSLPGRGMFIEPFMGTNTQSEGFFLGFAGWDPARKATGVWGHVIDAATVDLMNTQATPTPVPTATPTRAPDSNDHDNNQYALHGDLKATIIRVRSAKPSYRLSCSFKGQGALPYQMTVYRSADKKLDSKDKVVKVKRGSLTAGAMKPLSMSVTKKSHADYLIVSCFPMLQIVDSAKKNDVASMAIK